MGAFLQGEYGNQMLREGQAIRIKYRGQQFNLIIENVIAAPASTPYARFDPASTDVDLKLAASGEGRGISLKDGKTRKLEFKSNFNFEAMGIGGLDVQFTNMFRKAFATRVSNVTSSQV